MLLIEWPEYWSPDFELMQKQMKVPVIVDGRNVYDCEQIESLRFTCCGLDRNMPGNISFNYFVIQFTDQRIRL